MLTSMHNNFAKSILKHWIAKKCYAMNAQGGLKFQNYFWVMPLFHTPVKNYFQEVYIMWFCDKYEGQSIINQIISGAIL